jgi:hypothetical protein
MKFRIPLPHFTHAIECRDAQGNLKWVEKIRNTVVTVGMNALLDTFFSGASYTAAWYMGLMGSGTVADTDTMASHPGWSEITAITASARPGIAWNAASNGTKSVSTPTSFTMSAAATVYGAFIVNDLTLGGTAGTLYSGAQFSTSRTVAVGDVINVIPSLSV